MTIKSILVALEVDAPSKPLLSSAIGLARRFDAELHGVCAAQPSLGLIAVEGAVVIDHVYLEERREIERRLEEAEELFRTTVPVALTAKWRGYLESPSRTIIEAARGADLVMMRSNHTHGGDEMRHADPGEVVLGCGRPVLLAGERISSISASKVLIGWKDEKAARRAVADALPFLVAADEVFVVTVDEGDFGRAQVSLDDAAGWLRLHGVKVRPDIRPKTDSPAQLLEAIYREKGCDLLVTGAYGHNRLRERLFGGVTQELMTDAGLNRLMSS
ncbi:MAG TPA: universal stress protein [Devosia sp.]